MSLMIEAPAARAARATSALVVSIEIGILIEPESAWTTGITRASSSSSETGSAPGRLDSPPRSSRSAPWAAKRLANATASADRRFGRRRKSYRASG